MNFYTISMEYQGGTYISQVWADDETSALIEWAVKLDIRTSKGIGRQIKQRIISELEQGYAHNKPVPLNGVVNVWFAALLVRNKMLFIDIIKTVALI